MHMRELLYISTTICGETNKKYKLMNEVEDSSLALAEGELKLNGIYNKTETKDITAVYCISKPTQSKQSSNLQVKNWVFSNKLYSLLKAAKLNISITYL